jgi:nicotinate phosphoribosyltransferase
MVEASLSPGDILTPDYMNPLFTDKYQLTMSLAYFKAGRHETPAVFEAFFRKCPFKGHYAIFAGVDEVIKFL